MGGGCTDERRGRKVPLANLGEGTVSQKFAGFFHVSRITFVTDVIK